MCLELQPQGDPIPSLRGVGQPVDVVIAKPELRAQVTKAVLVVLRYLMKRLFD